MLRELDQAAFLLVNSFARLWPMLDRFVVDVLSLPSVRLLPIVACMTALWFHTSTRDRDRAAIFHGVAGAFVALVASRLIQDLMPSRPRPFYTEGLPFVPPIGAVVDVPRDWSSFPSDTTALTFALVTGICCASPLLGAVATLWAIVFVALPRVYLGYHYPFDLIGGALLGILPVLALQFVAQEWTSAWMERLELRFPALFYGLAFLVLFQVTIMFDDLRKIGREVTQAVPSLF